MPKQIQGRFGAKSLLSGIDAAPADLEQGLQPRVVVNPPDHIMEHVYRMRAAAWGRQARLTATTGSWSDRWDACSRHYVMLLGEDIIGAFRFSVHPFSGDLPNADIYGHLLDHLPGPIAWFSRLVVHPDFQGMGYSRQLDLLAISEPRKAGAASIIATGGSVAGNLMRREIMLRRGWTEAGQAIAMPQGEYVAEYAPQVFYMIFDR